jgi:hypothetical protein
MPPPVTASVPLALTSRARAPKSSVEPGATLTVVETTQGFAAGGQTSAAVVARAPRAASEDTRSVSKWSGRMRYLRGAAGATRGWPRDDVVLVVRARLVGTEAGGGGGVIEIVRRTWPPAVNARLGARLASVG